MNFFSKKTEQASAYIGQEPRDHGHGPFDGFEKYLQENFSERSIGHLARVTESYNRMQRGTESLYELLPSTKDGEALLAVLVSYQKFLKKKNLPIPFDLNARGGVLHLQDILSMIGKYDKGD